MWKNRIIGYEEVDPLQLLANPRNWRIHPQSQQEALEGVLDEVGWVDDIIVNQRTGFVLDGHLRVALAISQEQKTVPVKYIDVTEDEEMVLLATFDPITAMAVADKEILAELMTGIDSDNERIQQLLGDIAKREGIELETKEAPEAQIDRADELQKKWKVKRGQVWEIGRHRLMCGDSSDATNLDTLVRKIKFTMCLTSPPYCVGLDYEKVLSYEKLIDIVTKLSKWMIDRFPVGAYVFWNFGDIHARTHAKELTGEKEQCIHFTAADYWTIFRSHGWLFHAHRIWVKPYGALPMPWWGLKSTIPHHGEWEHLWTLRKPGGATEIVRDTKKSLKAVWTTAVGEEIENIRAYHDAGFPVVLPRWAMDVHTDKGDYILDPFIGSGTTMVAAEQLNRICYGMEIEPKYCAVTLERMSDMGLKPKLVDIKKV